MNNRWLYLVVALLAVLPFLSAWDNGFVFDDRGLIVEHPAVWADGPGPAWNSRYWPDSKDAGLYRPLTTVSFWLNANLAGENPRPFILTNLFLHLCVSLLVLSLLRALFPRAARTSAATAILFAVHPLHSEAVIGIVGRAELLAALGAVGAYRLGLEFLRGRGAPWGIASAAVLFVGLCGKESAVGIFSVLLFHLWSVRSRGASDDVRTVFGLGGFWFAALSVFLLLRINILGSLFGLGHVTRMDNPLFEAGTIERIGTALYIQLVALGQLVWPASLSPDYSYPQIVPTPALQAWGWAFLAALLAAFFLAVRGKQSRLLWGLVFATGTGLLTSNVPFPIGTVYGERLQYLPSLGSIWVLVAGTAWLFRNRPVPAALPLAVTILLAAALGARSFAKGPDWKSDLTLFGNAVEAVPNSTKAWTNLSLARSKANLFEEGMVAAERALALDPDYVAAQQAKASILNQTGEPEAAMAILEPHRQMPGRRGITALLELGNAHLLLQDGRAAEAEFRTVMDRVSDRPGPPDERWMVGMASAFALQGRWSESREYWQKAVSVKPGELRFRQRLAYVLWQDGDLDQAEAEYRRLLAALPDDGATMNELAWFLAQTGEGETLDEALRLAEQAFQRLQDANSADTWLVARIRARGCDDARSWLDEWRERLGSEIFGDLEKKWTDECGS